MTHCPHFKNDRVFVHHLGNCYLCLEIIKTSEVLTFLFNVNQIRIEFITSKWFAIEFQSFHLSVAHSLISCSNKNKIFYELYFNLQEVSPYVIAALTKHLITCTASSIRNVHTALIRLFTRCNANSI